MIFHKLCIGYLTSGRLEQHGNLLETLEKTLKHIFRINSDKTGKSFTFSYSSDRKHEFKLRFYCLIRKNSLINLLSFVACNLRKVCNFLHSSHDFLFIIILTIIAIKN